MSYQLHQLKAAIEDGTDQETINEMMYEIQYNRRMDNIERDDD